MENKLIIANLKAYMDAASTEKYLKEIKNKIKRENVIFAPSNLFVQKFIDDNYSVALQDISYKNDKKITGEILACQAKSIGVNYIIIGHSERMVSLEESKKLVKEKIINCLNNNLKVIICIGETKKTSLNKIYKVINEQLTSYLKNITNVQNILLAYEPYWAIGNNQTPNIEDIEKIIEYIDKYIEQKFNLKPIILYGGSINEKNIETLIQISNVSGFLVGESSTDSSKFLKIIEVAVK